MERLKPYSSKILDTIKSIKRASYALEITEQMEEQRKPFAFQMEEDDQVILLTPDEVTKKVWRGWIYGKRRELKKDHPEIVIDIFK